jgi:hypothetical protein
VETILNRGTSHVIQTAKSNPSCNGSKQPDTPEAARSRHRTSLRGFEFHAGFGRAQKCHEISEVRLMQGRTGGHSID